MPPTAQYWLLVWGLQIRAGDAVRVWDAIMEGGQAHHATPCGLEAMDIARVEAGFVLLGVDYISAETARLPHHRMSPYELGLGWAVKMDKNGPFVGRDALSAPGGRKAQRKLVGLEVGWEAMESLYLDRGLMPDLPLAPCREPVPVYNGARGEYAGRVTTRVWSTMLKKYLALATVDAALATPGTTLSMEVTVDFRRETVPATVTRTPFFKPDRMRA